MEYTEKMPHSFELSSKLSKAASTLVKVESGVHQGVEQHFDNGSLTIGQEADNDLVLFAENIAPNHCRIVRSKSPLSPVTVHAIGAPVLVNGERTLNPGEYAQFNSSLLLELGDCQISVKPSVEYNKYASTALKVGILIALLFAAWFAWNIFTGIMGNVVSIGGSIANNVSSSISQEQPAAQTQTVNEQLVWTVRTKLEELGLNGSVRAKPAADNNIHLTGAVTQRQSARWNEFLRWYDSNPTFPGLIREVQRDSKETPLPQIQSVWMDGTPMVQFKDGTSASVGDTLKDNWKVISIEKDNVVIERDGTPLTLSF